MAAAPPKFRNVHGLDRKGARATDDRVDFFGRDLLKLHRLPNDVGELRFPVRWRGEIPSAGKQATCFFFGGGFNEQRRRHNVGVHNKSYARPSSIALWISSRVISAAHAGLDWIRTRRNRSFGSLNRFG